MQAKELVLFSCESPAFGRAFLSTISSLPDWVELIRQLYLYLFQWVRWFLDLTCDFWAENAQNKFGGWKEGISQGLKPISLMTCIDSGLKPGPITKARTVTKTVTDIEKAMCLAWYPQLLCVRQQGLLGRCRETISIRIHCQAPW